MGASCCAMGTTGGRCCRWVKLFEFTFGPVLVAGVEQQADDPSRIVLARSGQQVLLATRCKLLDGGHGEGAPLVPRREPEPAFHNGGLVSRQRAR
jgi:hypothetical protein